MRDEFDASFLLSRSGFIGPEDIITQDRTPIGYTARFHDACSLDHADELPDLLSKIRVFQDVALAMAYLHCLGLLHCDLKPSNVLALVHEPSLSGRVIDLGLMARFGQCLPREIRGTHGFIAPEVFEGSALSIGTDVYSFGRILESTFRITPALEIKGGMTELWTRCTRASSSQRPTSFWDVYDELLRIGRRASTEAGIPRNLDPPLREAGVERGTKRLGRQLRLNSIEGGALVLVTGLPGVGLSKQIRHYCHAAQLEGSTTLRLTDIASLHDLLPTLSRLSSEIRRNGPHPAQRPLVCLETTRRCSFSTESLGALAQLARHHDWDVLLEIRLSQMPSSAAGWVEFPISPLNLLNCVTATSALASCPAATVT